jgi:hypothetical protein
MIFPRSAGKKSALQIGSECGVEQRSAVAAEGRGRSVGGRLKAVAGGSRWLQGRQEMQRASGALTGGSLSWGGAPALSRQRLCGGAWILVTDSTIRDLRKVQTELESRFAVDCSRCNVRNHGSSTAMPKVEMPRSRNNQYPNPKRQVKESEWLCCMTNLAPKFCGSSYI